MKSTKICNSWFVMTLLFAIYLYRLEIQPKESKSPYCQVNTNCNKLCKDQMDHTVREGASGLVQSNQEYLYQFLEFQLGQLNVQCDHIRSKSSYDKLYFLLGGSCHFTSNSPTCFFFLLAMILEFCVRDSVNLCLVVQNNSQQNCFFQGILRRVSNSSVPFTRPMYMHAPRPIWHP